MEFLTEDNAFNHLTESESSSQTSTEDTPDGSSRLSTIFLIINAALGAGLLNFPQAFEQAGGIAAAITIQAILLVWITAALIILAKCSQNATANTLQHVLLDVCGRSGLILCSVVVALYCFGTCVTFLIVIGDQFDRVLSSLYGNDFCHWWFMNRKFTIALSSCVLILPFCYSKRIDFLKYASSVGVIAVIYLVVFIVYTYFEGNFIPGPIKTAPTSWTDVFLVVPVICFGYQCHVSVIPIYSCMRERNIKNFSICAIISILVCMMAYTLTGVFGYWTFGSFVESDILESYSGRSAAILIGIVAIAIKTFTTYPILLFCGREAICNLWSDVTRSPYNDLRESRRRFLVISIWFVLTLILSVIIPDIGDVIGILGSLAAIFIFIFPGLCLLQTTLRRDSMFILIKNKINIVISILFLAFGAFIFGVVLVQSFERLLNDSPDKVQLCV